MAIGHMDYSVSHWLSYPWSWNFKKNARGTLLYGAGIDDDYYQSNKKNSRTVSYINGNNTIITHDMYDVRIFKLIYSIHFEY